MKNKRNIISVLCLTFAFFVCCAYITNSKSSIKNINIDNIKHHIEYQTNEIGVRPTGTPKEKECANYIYSELKKYGYSLPDKTLERKKFDVDAHSISSENIIAVKKSVENKGIIAVVSHYDTVSTTLGARDNASGIAALLELARVISASDNEFPYEIRFIALGAEEIGFWGATRYVESLTDDEKSKHIAVYNMDITIGNTEQNSALVCSTLGKRTPDGYVIGDFITPAHNLVSISIIDAFIELGYATAEDDGDEYWSAHNFGESDHVSFHKAGIDSANICWRRINGDYAKLPDEYHAMSDNTDNLDYSTIEKTAKSILKAIENVCESKYKIVI